MYPRYLSEVDTSMGKYGTAGAVPLLLALSTIDTCSLLKDKVGSYIVGDTKR